LGEPLIDREVPPERAGAIIPWTQSYDRPGPDRLGETSGLIEALGCELAFIRETQIRKPSPKYLLSGGLLEAFGDDLRAHDCTMAVVDGSLTPIQQRNLEKRLNMKVIDRTGLILEIFGLRARTKEGVLQVELARQLYERSRLVRTWTHLERQRGGGGFLAGPGETQLESDRRMLDDKVKRLRRDLEDVRRTRGLQRAGRRRSGTPVIALVGYTNSGKSTLFNRLSGARVFAKDMPFATLDPTIRKLELPTMGEAALVDTVGFITDLPTHLIDSFKATLEEAVEADLLVHVRDRSTASDSEQKQDVMKVLAHLEDEAGGELPPMIEVWNKADLLTAERHEALQLAAETADEPPAVIVSALKNKGMDALLALIEETLRGATRVIVAVLAPKDGSARAWLHSHGDVQSENMSDTGEASLSVRLDEETLGRFAALYPGIDVR